MDELVEPMTDAERARVIKIRMSHRKVDDGDDECSICFLDWMLDRAEKRLDQAEVRGAWRTPARPGLAGLIADRIESLTQFDGDMVAPLSRAGFRARIVEAIRLTIEAIEPLPAPPRAGGEK